MEDTSFYVKKKIKKVSLKNFTLFENRPHIRIGLPRQTWTGVLNKKYIYN